MHQRARLGIGYLPQEASVFRNLTVQQNILAILQLRKDLDSSARKQTLERLLEEFQIAHLRDVPREYHFPEENVVASKSRARWQTSLNSSCSTNPSPESTRYRSSIFSQ